MSAPRHDPARPRSRNRSSVRYPRIAVALIAALALGWTIAACAAPETSHWTGSGSATPTPGPDAGGSAEPSGSPVPGASGSIESSFAARLPRFGTPPPAEPLSLPSGPLAAAFHRLPITAPVAFLTIDDGLWQVPDAIPLMQAAHIPFTMFLIGPVAAKGAPFFRQLESAGGIVEDHTINHSELKGRSYGLQHREICDAATSLSTTFGRRPTLFRPPFGDYDNTTLRAAHDCGIKAVFYWSETVVNGSVRYQTANHKIQPGDIILMHFRTTFVADVIAALTAISRAGLTPALLENYIT